MDMVGLNAEGNLVDEWKQGNTRVRIFDNEYALRSEEDIKKTIDRVRSIAWNTINESRYTEDDS